MSKILREKKHWKSKPLNHKALAAYRKTHNR